MSATSDLDAVQRRLTGIRRAAGRQWALVAGSLGLLVLALFACRVLLGDYTVTVPDFFRLLAGENIPGARFIVMESKLPRALMGLLTGLSFGAAGAVFQTMLRNPLASPDIIGVSLGSSAGAVIAIVLIGGTGALVPVAALIGALVVAAVIFLLSRHQSTAGIRMVLVGIGVAALLQAVVVQLLSRTDIYRANDALQWIVGSLNGATWERLALLGLGLVLVAPFLAAWGRRLRILPLGDDLAAGLGLDVERTRLALLVVGVALTAFPTAAAGPISFIALLSGPIARRLNGGRATIVIAALVGAAIVLAADYAAAYLIPGTVLPVGVLTGGLGAPFMLWLLLSRRAGASEG
ncbi:iron chelate uptake ABC transporter family permease subunit [Tersicoccus sp. Bi-70]|uniref:FecCD family ABC transporter permease n=1 Tax=Tersicoccus sp. Bi-70 TaxID=1897634 RepID=UPI0009F9240A|nr:iron chelate uptake ABC transporter family permease subunit [Tersicoccus sp. Bi-70]